MIDQKVREVGKEIEKIAAQSGFEIKEAGGGKDLYVYLERDDKVQEIGIPIRILKDEDKGKVYANFSARHLYVNKINTNFTIKDGVKDEPENVCTLSFEEMRRYLSERRSFFYQADIFILHQELQAFDYLIKRLSKFFFFRGLF